MKFSDLYVQLAGHHHGTAHDIASYWGSAVPPLRHGARRADFEAAMQTPDVVHHGRRGAKDYGAFLATAFTPQPLVGFNNATASSTYSADLSAKEALKPGSGYWCSQGGQGADEVVTWTGVLNTRRKAKGIKIKWAYGPGEMKVLTSLDGEHFQEASCWQGASSDKPSYGQDVEFEGFHNVKAVTIAMKGSRSWPYFGIDEVALIPDKTEPGMIVNGITAPKGEQCLVVTDGGNLGIQTCSSSRAAEDYRDVFRFNEHGQLEHVDSGKCVIAGTAGVTAPAGAPVTLGDCKQARMASDGRSDWELSPDNQLKMSKEGKFCAVPKGNHIIAQDCGEAAETSTDARDKWFMTMKADYDKATADVKAMSMVAAA